MGYDMCFWRHDGADRSDPAGVNRALAEGTPVPGILRFPIRPFLAGLDEKWQGREREVNHPRYRAYRHSDASVVEVAWKDAYVCVTLRPLDQALANDVINVAASVDAPLYDPQLDERFDSDSDA